MEARCYGVGDFRGHDLITQGFPPGILSQGGVPSWSYASIAAAESSGDAWSDGDTITITGLSDLQMVFLSALNVDGHSGLIHKYPFSDAVEAAAASVVTSEPANTDPVASWTSWNDNSVGTITTDYDLDINSSRGRLRNITGSGRFDVEHATPPASGKTRRFMVIDDVNASTAGSGGRCALSLPVYYNGSVVKVCNLQIVTTTSATNWIYYTGGGTPNDSGFPFATRTRFWLYADSGSNKIAIWTDASSAPITGTILTAGANKSFRFLSGSLGGSDTLEIGYFVGADIS